MKITSIQAHIMGVPSPGGAAPSRNWIFVRVRTDAGLEGVGEATTEYHEQAVAAMVEQHFAPLLVGQDPRRVQQSWQQMQRCFWWRGGVVASSAASGIEQALWDIAGKAYGLPVHRLLGGAVRDRVRVYARNDLGLPTLVDEARAAVAEGFDAFKFGPGNLVRPFDERRQLSAAVEAVEQVRAAVGDRVDLMLDCGGLFSATTAQELAAATRGSRLLFLEEPVNQDAPHGLMELRRACPWLPVAAGERLMTRWQFREWIERSAVSVIQADVSHCGGIGELLRIASWAEVYGILMAPHNPYGPVALAASAHAALCMPNFLILEHCRLRPWFDEVQKSDPSSPTEPATTVRDGQIELGERHGLGVELDWEFVAAHPYRPRPLRMVHDRFGALPPL